MLKNKLYKFLGITLLTLLYTACSVPNFGRKTENKTVPTSYNDSKDTVNTAKTKWKDYFKDPQLTALIDSALTKNQELNIVLQEINISKNEVRARKGAFLPFMNAGVGAGAEKVGRYTSQGASDANNQIMPGKEFPDPLQNYLLGVNVSWEVDIWKKLRNSKKSALYKYLSTVEGKNFMVTNLISEIANSYYELVALDNQLDILNKNIDLYLNSLEIVKLEKQSARVTELAVRRFEAEVLKNQSRKYYIMQQITITENKINFLAGRFPQNVARNSVNFTDLVIDSIHAGIPSQLLSNRSDIRQAEQGLLSAKLDVKAAKAEFYPSFFINAGAGFNAFNPKYLIQAPQSLLYNIAGDLVAPLINRNAIKANFYSANSKQIQAVYNYERAILKAHIEVVNQLSNINNLNKSYDLKSKQVQALTESIDISTTLFKSARADYMEVLLTQRDALESKIELVETKKLQMNAMVNMYKVLGGGWN
ncbi:MAG: TolC family protein [Bacteroidota bacterium]|nr:TolC family protein [Bacteroidota bacterium]MDP3144742.1 TolC family protein [Bacteroidota bacterium]